MDGRGRSCGDRHACREPHLHRVHLSLQLPPALLHQLHVCTELTILFLECKRDNCGGAEAGGRCCFVNGRGDGFGGNSGWA
jgi:hypothetical protein